MPASASARNAPVAVTAGLIALGVIFAALGVVYLARTANQLPALLPGHPGRIGPPPHQARPRRVRAGHLVLGRSLVHHRQAHPQPGLLTPGSLRRVHGASIGPAA